MSGTLRILYVGSPGGTSRDRADAYRRLGHRVRHLDLRGLLPPTVWVDRITWRLGGHWFGPWVAARLAERLRGGEFDLCHVDRGEWIDPAALRVLKRHCAVVVNYNGDDPFGRRDGRRFSAYRRALPGYDLVAVVRGENVDEARRAGARAVVRVFHAADELSHAPRPIGDVERCRWGSDVLFVGTWMPERGPFLLELARLGVPLAIRGPGWQKAPEWPRLQRFWRGDALHGDDYALAIQCARINLGLLSKGNRDLHTTRSLEIPALGALLCAERTPEHEAMYRDGEEAVLWSDAECARHCAALLADDARRRRIAARGHLRVRRNGHYNEAMLSQLLGAAGLGLRRTTAKVVPAFATA